MRELDVRDIHGRLLRVVCSIVAGALLAVVIAVVLPQRSSSGWGVGAFGMANPVLVGAGAVAIALGIYAVLGAVMRRAPRIVIPRATLVRWR